MPATTERAERVAAATERCACPTFDGVEDVARRAKRTLVDVRHKAEDAAGEARLIVRRHPIAWVSLGSAVGVLLGAACGLLIGRVVAPRV